MRFILFSFCRANGEKSIANGALFEFFHDFHADGVCVFNRELEAFGGGGFGDFQAACDIY